MRGKTVSRTQTAARYGLIAQGFHWLVALLIVGLLVTDSLREAAPKDSEAAATWLHLHMSLGMLVFLVAVARIGWAKLVPPPPPVLAPRWSTTAAVAAHVLLNLATLLIPIFGYLRVASKGRTADFFGVQIPSLIGDQPWLHDLMRIAHGFPMEVFLYALVGLHVAAAIWHQYERHDGALARTLPWGARAPG
jgi:cytochrome b561